MVSGFITLLSPYLHHCIVIFSVTLLSLTFLHCMRNCIKLPFIFFFKATDADLDEYGIVTYSLFGDGAEK